MNKIFAAAPFILCASLSFLDTSGLTRTSAQHGFIISRIKPRFGAGEDYVNKERGGNVRVKCNVLNWQSDWKVNWYLNGKTLHVSRRKRFRNRTGTKPLLLIRKLRKKDAGVYRCTVSNKYGSASMDIKLNVVGKRKPQNVPGKGPPRFSQPKFSGQFIAWPAFFDLKLRCAAKGERPLKYQWLKDGKALRYRRLDPNLDSTKWFLRLRTAVPSDDGLYTCIVSNRLGNISSSFKLNVLEKVRVRPILSTRFPFNKTVNIGDDVTFECLELISPALTDHRWIHWNKLPPEYPDLKLDNDFLSKSSSYFTVINGNQYLGYSLRVHVGGTVGYMYGTKVILKNVTKDDEGIYTCVVSNHVGKSQRSAFLQVVNSSERTPFVIEADMMKKGSFEDEVNNSGKMACSAAVVAKQPAKRSKNGKSLENIPGKSDSISPHQFTITLKSVKPKIPGTYTCNVSSHHEAINMTYNISEREMCGPILEDFKNVTATVGQDVTLICKAYNSEKPKLIWFAFDYAAKQYKMILEGKRFKLAAVQNTKKRWQGKRLRVLNVTSADSKQYLCLGVNTVLSRSQSVFVNVFPKKLKNY